MITIEEIARKTGFSKSTVSRVLNGDQTLSVRETTRQLIIDTADKYHYIKKSKKIVGPTIGLVTVFSENRENNDTYWRQINLGIASEASHSGNIFVDDIIRLDQKTNLLSLGQYDALIILGEISATAVQKIKDINNNLVLVDGKNRYQNIDAVDPELENMTIKILDELYQSGRRNIGFIGGYNDLVETDGRAVSTEKDIRHESYKKWARKNNQREYIYEGNWSADTGKKGAKELLDRYPDIDAFLMASDPIAIGAINTIKNRNLTMGKEIAIVSFDNLDLVKYLVPSLTSIDLKPLIIGKTALIQAIQLSNGDRDWTMWSTIPAEIHHRETFLNNRY